MLSITQFEICVQYNDNPIRNIIFDLGGVLLNIDYNLCVEEFRKLGMKEFDLLYSKARQSDLFDKLETGKISASDFRSEIKRFLRSDASDIQIDEAWNAMLLDMPKERMNLLLSLKKKYKIFLLSNTNEIHIKKLSEILTRSFNVPDLSHVFEKVYFSHLIKLRKPEQEFFELVLSENNLIAEETLFIDDSLQHIEGARKSRINALHLVKEKTILDLF